MRRQFLFDRCRARNIGAYLRWSELGLKAKHLKRVRCNGIYFHLFGVWLSPCALLSRPRS
jgi:hypothetical protein